jgi:hypothetical protein
MASITGYSDTVASQTNVGKGIENTNCQRNYNRTIISESVLVLRVVPILLGNKFARSPDREIIHRDSGSILW